MYKKFEKKILNFNLIIKITYSRCNMTTKIIVIKLNNIWFITISYYPLIWRISKWDSVIRFNIEEI